MRNKSIFEVIKIIIATKFFKYFLVNGFTAIFELIIYTILYATFQVDPVISAPIAQIIITVINFPLVKYFTFDSKGDFWKQFIQYILLVGFNIVLTAWLMDVLIKLTAIHPTIIRFVVMGITFVMNFVIFKVLIFRQGSILNRSFRKLSTKLAAIKVKLFA